MKFSHTLKTSASPEKIWSIWTDVEHWSKWDTELSDAYLESPFALGARGKLTPKQGRVSTFKISQLIPGKSYTFTINLPLCSLNVHRYLNVQSDGTYFTHEITFQGLLAFLFGQILGRQFQAVLPSVMQNVKQIAELRQSSKNC
ncbi:SRPBCC family protein [Nostoc spongiaeforme FACHB-130]|uniref:SRPBCC family protein n=1 Tax=Nostoc spongiaeforme FACHB-130 TaxID=1357510 RepID=A0ABR8G2D6_9NOSO|nr:SRPBCC family protein [Nostoc spongiaeforme]MBD2597395.1 SRPBCC family protein [Nostoc spongiaeforme FACHB-130]